MTKPPRCGLTTPDPLLREHLVTAPGDAFRCIGEHDAPLCPDPGTVDHRRARRRSVVRHKLRSGTRVLGGHLLRVWLCPNAVVGVGCAGRRERQRARIHPRAPRRSTSSCRNDFCSHTAHCDESLGDSSGCDAAARCLGIDCLRVAATRCWTSRCHRRNAPGAARRVGDVGKEQHSQG